MRFFLFVISALFTLAAQAQNTPKIIYDCGDGEPVSIVSFKTDATINDLFVQFNGRQEPLKLMNSMPSYTTFYYLAESTNFEVNITRTNSPVTGNLIQTATVQMKKSQKSWDCEYTFPNGDDEGQKNPYRMARQKRDRERRLRNGPISK